MDNPTLAEHAEALEAQVRHAMHDHAQIVPRGWATIRDRATLHREIDRLLDELAVLDGIPLVVVEQLPDRSMARLCGVCGRTRYSNFSGAVVCMACDGHPLGKWVGIEGETVE